MQLQQETSASPFVSHNFPVVAFVVILVITRRTATHCTVLGSDSCQTLCDLLPSVRKGFVDFLADLWSRRRQDHVTSSQ